MRRREVMGQCWNCHDAPQKTLMVAGTLRRQVRAPRARGDCVSAADSPISSIGVRTLNKNGFVCVASSDRIRKLPAPINRMLTIRAEAGLSERCSSVAK